jgi:hypothetical protein
VNNLSLTGILSLIVIGGAVGTAFYYRDGIKDAFAQTQKSEAEKDYDFDRKKKEDKEWDNSGWNPDNWGGYTNSKTYSKTTTKNNVYDPNTDPSKFNPPNSEYNHENPYGYDNKQTTNAGWY